MRAFIIFVFTLAATAFSAGAQPEEISLPEFQANALKEDLPARSLHLGADHTKAVILGRANLWVWDLAASRLARMALGEQAGTLRQLLALDDGRYVVAGDDALLVITLTPVKILRLAFPGAKGGASIGVFAKRESLVWVHADGLAVVSIAAALAAHRIPTPSTFTVDDKLSLSADTQWLWIARNRTLSRLNMDETGAGAEQVHQTSQDIRGLVPDKSAMLAWTDNAVLIFSASGRLKQAVPVDGPRTIAGVTTSANYHVYLFNDGLIEIYDLVGKKHTAGMLALDGNRPESLSWQNSYAGTIAAGLPRLFRGASPEAL